jgi:hypothetical protein
VLEGTGTVRILETDAKVIPHVDDRVAVGRATGLPPATAHVHKITRIPDGGATSTPARGDSTPGPAQATGS